MYAYLSDGNYSRFQSQHCTSPCLAYSTTTGTVKSECLGDGLSVVVIEMKK